MSLVTTDTYKKQHDKSVFTDLQRHTCCRSTFSCANLVFCCWINDSTSFDIFQHNSETDIILNVTDSPIYLGTHIGINLEINTGRPFPPLNSLFLILLQWFFTFSPALPGFHHSYSVLFVRHQQTMTKQLKTTNV